MRATALRAHTHIRKRKSPHRPQSSYSIDGKQVRPCGRCFSVSGTPAANLRIGHDLPPVHLAVRIRRRAFDTKPARPVFPAAPLIEGQSEPLFEWTFAPHPTRQIGRQSLAQLLGAIAQHGLADDLFVDLLVEALPELRHREWRRLEGFLHLVEERFPLRAFGIGLREQLLALPRKPSTPAYSRIPATTSVQRSKLPTGGVEARGWPAANHARAMVSRASSRPRRCSRT